MASRFAPRLGTTNATDVEPERDESLLGRVDHVVPAADRAGEGDEADARIGDRPLGLRMARV